MSFLEFVCGKYGVRGTTFGLKKSMWPPNCATNVPVTFLLSTSQPMSRGGMGVVARDSAGTVLLSASKSFWPVVHAERAEIEAFTWATGLVKDHNWSKVVIEGDAQIVVKALQGSISP